MLQATGSMCQCIARHSATESRALRFHVQAEYDKAWEHLVEANRLQRDTYTFNPQVLQPVTTPMNRIADTCRQL